MQQFIVSSKGNKTAAYMPLSGFTAVDLGYQKGDAVSNIVNKFNEVEHTGIYLQLFNQIWNDEDKLQDITDILCEHIESVYQENAPERVYFLILYNIFRSSLKTFKKMFCQTI